MIWDGIEAVEMFGVDVGIVFVLFADRIVCDVDELILEIVFVSNAVFVITAVPDFSRGLLARSEGVSALDVLNALCCWFVDDGRDEDVSVVGHDDKAVKLEATFVTMLEERCDEEFGIGCALEVAMSLKGQDRDWVGALLLADGSHGRERIPQGLKPLSVERAGEGQAWRLGLPRSKGNDNNHCRYTAATAATTAVQQRCKSNSTTATAQQQQHKSNSTTATAQQQQHNSNSTTATSSLGWQPERQVQRHSESNSKRERTANANVGILPLRLRSGSGWRCF
jgi:hypothetical protein